MEEVPHKRFFKNYFINPPMQTRMSYYFVAFALCLIGGMMFILNHYLSQVRALVVSTPGISMIALQSVDSQFHTFVFTSLLFLAFGLLVSIVYGIIISHRIAGPMFAILRYIETLRAGRYDETRRLRPYDELMPIMNALHDLAGDLKKKS